MCNVYTGTDKNRYASTSRSIRILGCVTSIKLENEFWRLLDEIAAAEGQSTPKFINTLYKELIDNHSEVRNFTSFLRVVCPIYLTQKLLGHEQSLLDVAREKLEADIQDRAQATA